MEQRINFDISNYEQFEKDIRTFLDNKDIKIIGSIRNGETLTVVYVNNQLLGDSQNA